MEQVKPSPRVVRFGAFEADLHGRELRKKGVRVRLQDQPFQVLAMLLENPREVVTREELRQKVWTADTFVDFDNSLNTAINKIREALGDSAEHPRFVETLPRRGYRFIGTVNGTTAQGVTKLEVAPALREKTELQAHGRKSATSFALAGGVAAVLTILLAFNLGGLRDRFWGKATSARIQSLAVLPLTNLSGDPAQEYFADGMTDALINDLSQISALKVISRTSSMGYKKTDKTLPQIARELDVDAIVEGTVMRSGDRVRITAQLIQGATDKHIWVSSYERSLEDILSLQGDIAREIAEEIRVKLTPQESVRMTHVRPINLKAVEAYLQGRYHYQKAKDMGSHRGIERAHEEELKVAIDFFQRAVAEDPNYAPAYVAMAEVWAVPATFPYPSHLMAQPATEALRKALAIDPTLAEAHVDLARIEFRDWHWQAAEREVNRAIELNPNLASAHAFYSHYLNAMGRLDESMEQAERTKALDPGDDRVAWVFYDRRQFDRFIELKKSDIARHAFGPMAHLDLGFGYERAGMYKEAVEEWEQAQAGFGYEELAEDLRRGYTTGGFRGAVREWVAGLEAISKQGQTVWMELPAYLYAILGDKDRAFVWLEKGVEQHSSNAPQLKTDPTWDDLRSDPRYAKLVRRVGIPP